MLFQSNNDQPCAATVAFVHEDGETVNLSVLKHDGRPFPARSVPYDEEGRVGSWRYPPFVAPKADPAPATPSGSGPFSGT